MRLIGPSGGQIGVVSLQDALEAAAQVSLDLVEIAPDGDPPVCKVMDYGKHVFEAKKQKAAAKKKQKRTQIKGRDTNDTRLYRGRRAAPARRRAPPASAVAAGRRITRRYRSADLIVMPARAANAYFLSPVSSVESGRS